MAVNLAVAGSVRDNKRWNNGVHFMYVQIRSIVHTHHSSTGEEGLGTGKSGIFDLFSCVCMCMCGCIRMGVLVWVWV